MTNPKLQDAAAILKKYPDRVPVICQRAKRSSSLPILQKKFLVPAAMAMGEFQYVVHKHLVEATQAAGASKLKSEQTVYLFVNGKTQRTSVELSEVYASNKDSDGFLYVTYSSENTLG
mmetsp:Transcript_37778/g.70484  ORF Transcript_37778/g.70484 Transcript_37778/m.70484 type:complete len:118 (+) Transcript_37778:51-404(+)